jgi:large subunit ribosomal protein L11
VNLVEVKRAYDQATASQRGDIVPVVITVFEDRKFELRYKTPPTAFLIKKALRDRKVLSQSQLRAIAERKLPDLNTTDLDAAMRTVAGTARSMGVAVEPTIL